MKRVTLLLVELITEGTTRKYHEKIELFEGADLASARSKYNNDILKLLSSIF